MLKSDPVYRLNHKPIPLFVAQSKHRTTYKTCVSIINDFARRSKFTFLVLHDSRSDPNFKELRLQLPVSIARLEEEALQLVGGRR